VDLRISSVNVKNFVPGCIAFVLFFITVSRGLLELALPRGLAMALQMVAITGILTALCFLAESAYDKKGSPFYIKAFAFLVTIIISSLVTDLMGFPYWYIYFGFTVFTLFIGAASIKLCSSQALVVPIHFFALILGITLVFLSVLETRRYISLPGETWFYLAIRPASLTGSYLHYPIVVSLLAFIIIEWFFVKKQIIYLLGGALCWIAPIIAMSRSGSFISIFSMIVYIFINLRTHFIRSLFVILIGAVSVLFILAIPKDNVGENSWTTRALRLVTAMNTSAEGNEGRIDSWVQGINQWEKTNLLVGEKTGIVTNSTANMVEKETSFIVESGILQQLLNFGLVGLVLFYAILMNFYFYIDKKHLFLRSVFLAGLCQTVFYQSIEVVAFMVILLMLPWVSHMFNLWEEYTSYNRLNQSA
jgi:hypothetical protein